MEILHLINITTYGGAENLLTTFLPEFKKHNITVSCAILCPAKTPEAAKMIKDRLEKKEVEVFYKEFHSPWELNNFKWLTKVFRKKKYDLIHCHLKHAETWIYILKLFGKIPAPFIATTHGYNDRYMNRFGLRMVRRELFSLYYWTSRIVYRRIDGIIYISNCIKKFYSDASFAKGKESVIIHHGYIPMAKEISGRKTKDDKIIKPRIVIWGRIVERKGHLYAAKVIKELQNLNTETELHIYGIGIMEEMLRRILHEESLQSSVFFHGYKENIIQELQQYDIALLPSYWEPFGLVFLDAFDAGLPVVAFDLPAGNEIVRNNYNGLLAKPYDAADLADKINVLCNDKGLREKVIKNGKHTLQTEFSIELMLEKHISFYSHIISGKKRNKKDNPVN